MLYPERLSTAYTPFLEMFFWDLSSHLGKPLGPSCFSQYSLLFPFMLYFCTVTVCVNMLTHFPLVDVLVLMDPNGLPLQVFNPKLRTAWLYTIPLGCSIPCRHPARNPWTRLYTTAPPPCQESTDSTQMNVAPCSSGLVNPSCQNKVNKEILRLEDYSRRSFLEAKKSKKGDSDQNISHCDVHLKDWILLVE